MNAMPPTRHHRTQEGSEGLQSFQRLFEIFNDSDDSDDSNEGGDTNEIVRAECELELGKLTHGGVKLTSHRDEEKTKFNNPLTW